MHESFLQKGLPIAGENSYRFEENTRERGTVSIRIYQMAKHGDDRTCPYWFHTNIKPRVRLLVKTKKRIKIIIDCKAIIIHYIFPLQILLYEVVLNDEGRNTVTVTV